MAVFVQTTITVASATEVTCLLTLLSLPPPYAMLPITRVFSCKSDHAAALLKPLLASPCPMTSRPYITWARLHSPAPLHSCVSTSSGAQRSMLFLAWSFPLAVPSFRTTPLWVFLWSLPSCHSGLSFIITSTKRLSAFNLR